MLPGLVLAATLQGSYTTPRQLRDAGCAPVAPATSTMTAHARLLDSGFRFMEEDSLPGMAPGSRVSFSWILPAGFYWVEAWASNAAGAGCPARRQFQLSPVPPVGGDTLRASAPLEPSFEVFDMTGRRVARGRGAWDAAAFHPGIYWVRVAAGAQVVVRRVLLK